MALVNYDVFPVDFAEVIFLLQDVFIGGQADVEFLFLQLLGKHFSFLRISFENKKLHTRCPFIKLQAPIMHGA